MSFSCLLSLSIFLSLTACLFLSFTVLEFTGNGRILIISRAEHTAAVFDRVLKYRLAGSQPELLETVATRAATDRVCTPSPSVGPSAPLNFG